MGLFTFTKQQSQQEVITEQLETIKNSVSKKLIVDPTPSYVINDFKRSFRNLRKGEVFDSNIEALIHQYQSQLVVDICKNYITYLLDISDLPFSEVPKFVELGLVQKNKLFLYNNIITHLQDLLAFFNGFYGIIPLQNELYGIHEALKDLQEKAEKCYLEAFSQWGDEYEAVLRSNYLQELSLPLQMNAIHLYAELYPRYNDVQDYFPKSYYTAIVLFFLRTLAREGSAKWLPHLSMAKTAFTYLDIPLEDILTKPEDLALVSKLFDLETV